MYQAPGANELVVTLSALISATGCSPPQTQRAFFFFFLFLGELINGGRSSCWWNMASREDQDQAVLALTPTRPPPGAMLIKREMWVN